MKGTDLHPKDHSIQLFTDTSNKSWGAHLEQTSTKGLWSDQGIRLHINVLEKKGGFSGPSKVQGPVLKPNSVGCYRQLNSSSLHKYIRRNPLGGDVRSPVKDHDLVPSLQDNLKSQTHSRVSEFDGQPSVQVEPIQSTEWSLHSQVFKLVFSKYPFWWDRVVMDFRGRVRGYSRRWAIIGDSTKISTFTNLKLTQIMGSNHLLYISSATFFAFKTVRHRRNVNQEKISVVHSKHGCLLQCP